MTDTPEIEQPLTPAEARDILAHPALYPLHPDDVAAVQAIAWRES